MILVDINQVLISTLWHKIGNSDVTSVRDMIRHMVINSLRGFNVKFKNKYGNMVLCSDAGDLGVEIYTHYKYSRRKVEES